MNIHHIIEQSISGLKSKQEPDYIAALVTHLPVPLSSVLNKALPNLKFKVGGCFIQSKTIDNVLRSKTKYKKSRNWRFANNLQRDSKQWGCI